jgi:hypothetical protein
MKREVYVVPNVTESTVIDEDKKLTKVYYSQKYYDSAIKITENNAEEKLANAKLPAPVLISGTVTDSVDYQSRISIGKLKGMNWFGKEYKGGWLFNGESMFVAKFPIGSTDYKTMNGYSPNKNITNLFCVASEAAGDEIKLMTQDILWFSMPNSNGVKTKLSDILTRKNKTAGGKSIYIDFKDCAFVKFEEHQNKK